MTSECHNKISLCSNIQKLTPLPTRKWQIIVTNFKEHNKISIGMSLWFAIQFAVGIKYLKHNLNTTMIKSLRTLLWLLIIFTCIIYTCHLPETVANSAVICDSRRRINAVSYLHFTPKRGKEPTTFQLYIFANYCYNKNNNIYSNVVTRYMYIW